MRKPTGSYRTYSSLVKLQPSFLSLQWKTCLWAELQPWCLVCSEGPALGQKTDDDDSNYSSRTVCSKISTTRRCGWHPDVWRRVLHVGGDYFWSLKQCDSYKNVFFIVNSIVAPNYWMIQVYCFIWTKLFYNAANLCDQITMFEQLKTIFCI